MIAWSIQMAFHPAFPIAVYNMWQSAAADLRVFAGNTDDTNQGAVAVVPEYGDIYKPEIYVTAKKVGGLEIIDARGRRLVLRSYRTNDLFYFDIPSRQFVATLQSEAPATVTPLPTFTPTATLMFAPVQDTEVVTPYPMHVATVVGSYP